MPTRLYWRDTLLGDDGFPIYALDEATGTAATVQVQTSNTDTFQDLGAWRAAVGEGIDSTSFPTSFVISARGNGTVRIRIERRNAAGTVLAFSDWGVERATVGTHTETFTMANSWEPGDLLTIRMQGRRAAGTHGGSTIDIGVNRAGSYVDATFAEPAGVTYDGTGSDASTSSETGTSARETSVTAVDESASDQSGAATTVVLGGGANQSATSEAAQGATVAFPVGSDASASAESGTSTPSFSALASDASDTAESGAGVVVAAPLASNTSTSTQQGTAQVVGAPSETYDAAGSDTSASAQTGTAEAIVAAVGVDASASAEQSAVVSTLDAVGGDASTSAEAGQAEAVSSEANIIDATGSNASGSEQTGAATAALNTTGNDTSASTQTSIAAATLNGAGSDTSTSAEAGAAASGDITAAPPNRTLTVTARGRIARARDSPAIARTRASDGTVTADSTVVKSDEGANRQRVTAAPASERAAAGGTSTRVTEAA